MDPRATTVVNLALGALGALGLAALTGCSGNPPAPTGQHESDETAFEQTAKSSAALSGPITRSAAIANAELWVAAQLQYCQSPNGQPDPDTSCSSTCNRTSNPQWDPYRSDCSGFVSWAWGLPAPGLTTAGFAPYDTSVTSSINCTDMKAGDAANKSPNRGHIVIFKEWVTPGTEAVFIEEPGCSSSQPYAHEFQSAVTCSGSTANIAYEGDTFEAIRYVNIQDDPADAGTGSSSGSSSGGSSSGSGSGSGSGSSSSGSGSSSGGTGSSSGSSSGGTSNGGSGSSSGGGSGGGSGSGSGGITGGGSSSSGGGATPQGNGGAPGGDGGTAGWANLGNASTGCDVAPGPSRSGFGALAAVGLGLLVTRRRRARARQ